MRNPIGTFGDNYDDATAVAFGKANFKELSTGGKVLYRGIVFPLFYIILPIATFLTFIVYVVFKLITLITRSFTQTFARHRNR